MDYDKAASWNPALAYTQILAKPDEELMLTYQAGLFSRKCASLHLLSHPPSPRYVRAWQHPTCMELTPTARRGQSQFRWLLQCDFGGLLPVSLLNMVMPYCIKLFINSLKKHLKKCKK